MFDAAYSDEMDFELFIVLLYAGHSKWKVD
jgi:hypothetical protein